MRIRVFNGIDHQAENLPGDAGGILAESGQARLHHLAHADAVITGQADIRGHADPLGFQQPQRAETAVIIGAEHAVRFLLQPQQRLNDGGAFSRFMEVAVTDVFRGNADAQLRADFVEAGEPFLAHGALFPLDQGDPPVTAGKDMTDDLLHAGAVVAANAVAAFIGVVNDDGGNAAGGQTDDAGGIIVRLHHDHAVQAALTGMLIITVVAQGFPAENSQVITPVIGLGTQVVNQGRKILMVHAVLIEDAQIAGTARFQGFGRHVRVVSHIPGRLADEGSPLLAFAGETVQGAGNGRDRNAADLRDIF